MSTGLWYIARCICTSMWYIRYKGIEFRIRVWVCREQATEGAPTGLVLQSRTDKWFCLQCFLVLEEPTDTGKKREWIGSARPEDCIIVVVVVVVLRMTGSSSRLGSFDKCWRPGLYEPGAIIPIHDNCLEYNRKVIKARVSFDNLVHAISFCIVNEYNGEDCSSRYDLLKSCTFSMNKMFGDSEKKFCSFNKIVCW